MKIKNFLKSAGFALLFLIYAGVALFAGLGFLFIQGKSNSGWEVQWLIAPLAGMFLSILAIKRPLKPAIHLLPLLIWVLGSFVSARQEKITADKTSRQRIERQETLNADENYYKCEGTPGAFYARALDSKTILEFDSHGSNNGRELGVIENGALTFYYESPYDQQQKRDGIKLVCKNKNGRPVSSLYSQIIEKPIIKN